MRELRRRAAGSLEDQHVLISIREMVLPPDDVRDAEVGIVGTGSEVVGRHAVGTEQGEIFDIGRRLHLLAIDRVAKSHHLPGLARYAKTQCKWLSRCGAPVAFRAG